MIAQNVQFENAGANGFVFGVLNADDTINIQDCKALIESIKNKASHIVFHRAFVLVPEPELALEQLIELGFTGVLTSGQSKNAVDGLEKLKTLVAQANGRMEVIVGGGVRSHNIESLFETGAKWFHSAAWDLENKRFDPEELERILIKRATTANM